MSSFSHPFSSIAIIVLSKLGQLLSMQWVYEYIDDIRFPESRNHFGYEIPKSTLSVDCSDINS